MYSLLLSGLTSLGGQILSKTIFAPPTNSSSSLSFSSLLAAKEKNAAANDGIDQLADAIKNHPTLKELRGHGEPNAKLTLEITPDGNYLIKENEKALLQCSPNSELGQLCISFKTLCLINNKNLEIDNSNIAFLLS